MSYSLNSLSDGCYDGTTVLKNKFGIKKQDELDKVEQVVTASLLAKAFVDISFKNVDFKFYKMLHQYVFSDIYDWAGKNRNVNMSKKGTLFCDYKKIDMLGDDIFSNLRKNHYLKSFSDDIFLDEFTSLYCSLNYLHPFREGNGRIQRLFLSMMLNYIGKSINFTKIDKDLFLIATIKSASGDIFLLRDIFKEHIS